MKCISEGVKNNFHYLLDAHKAMLHRT